MINKYNRMLDIFRIACVLWIAYLFQSYYFFNHIHYPQAFWHPVGIMRFLDRSTITQELMYKVEVLFWISLGLSFFGLLTRWALILSAITLTFLMSHEMSYGFMSHREPAMILTLFILSAFPVGHVYSLDAVIFKRPLMATEKDVDWFLFFIRALFCVAYFSAGIYKLRISGLSWITTPALVYYLQFITALWPNYWLNNYFPDLGYQLSLYPNLCRLLCALVLILEVGAPLALFVKKTKWPIVLGLAAMQLATFFILKISFLHFLILFLAWLPWKRILDQSKAATR